MVVLSVGLHTSSAAQALAAKLGVELDDTGFVKGNGFDPVLTSRPGVLTCGTMTGPRDIPETVMQASGAASAAAALVADLPARRIETEYPPSATYAPSRLVSVYSFADAVSILPPLWTYRP